MKTKGWVIGVLVLAFQLSFANFSSAGFPERWMEAKNGYEVQIPNDIRATLKNRQILYVGGLLNELVVAPKYFRESRRVAKELDIKTTYYGPPTRKAISVNAENLLERVIKLYRKHKKPLILFGHSKGGVEILTLILNHPELTTVRGGLGDDPDAPIVDRLVLMQAPVAGSPLVQKGMYSVPLHGLSLFIRAGLESLDPEALQREMDHNFSAFWSKLNQQHALEGRGRVAEIAQSISNRIFYFRSWTRHPSTMVQMLLAVCQGDLTSIGESDGLVLVRDQMDKRIGIDLGLIEADHVQMEVGGPASLGSDREREAFTRLLLSTIYE